MTRELYRSLRGQLNFQYQGRHTLVQLCFDFALMAASYFLIQQSGILAYISTLTIATLMIRNVSVMHEAVHGLGHPNSKLNYLLGLWSGTLCLLPFHLWKKIHMEHHYWAGNFHKDPALEIIKRYPQASKLTQGFLDFSWKTRLPLSAATQYLVFWTHSIIHLLKKPKEPLLWLNILVPISLWSIVLQQLQGRQFGIFALGIIVYLAIFEFINFPHHVGKYIEQGSENSKLPSWQQYEIARTSIYIPLMEKFFLLNFNYHAEHHVFPDLPWHELPKAHRLMQNSEAKPRTEIITTGWLRIKRRLPLAAYLRPDYYENLKSTKNAS